MGEKIRQHIRSNVIGYIALFVALSGTAYAANTVGSSDIIDESILSQDIKNGEVKNNDLGTDAVGSGKIVDSAVRSADVADDTTDFGLTAQDLEPASVGTSEVADKSLTGKDVGFGELTGANVADTSLTGADVGDSTLTGADIAPSSLTGSDVADQSLSAVDIANNNSLGGAEIDESDLNISSLVFARGEGSTLGQCDGLLSSSAEICADVLVTLSLPSQVFIVASGGWSKELGDPAESLCRIEVDDQDPPEHLLFMGENTGFGGGHSAPRRQMPFTLNATTGRLNAGTHSIALKCQDNSSGDQDTRIGNARISALVVAG
jgi:hypothetical protein